jgi:uncharacterized protein (TIGR02597 family)
MIQTPKTASQNSHATGAKNPPPEPTHFHNPNKKSTNSMRLKSTSLTLAAAAVLAALPLANAQNVTATTDPVGFTSYTVRSKSDQRLGIPLVRPTVFSGVASSVSGTSVAASGLTVLSGSHYLVVTSGSASGSWESITSSATGQVTLAAGISGFTSNATFAIKPFWTLSTLLSSSGGIPVSPDVYEPQGFVFLYNPSSTGINLTPSSSYIYHNGSERTAGWYDANDPDSGLKNGSIISPETFIAVRNNSTSNATVTFVGSVPTSKFALDIVKRSGGSQDNLVYNKFPVDVTLLNSELASSGSVSASPDVYEPTDYVFFYSLNNSGFNPSASSGYIYHDGSERTAGWYDVNDPDAGLKNNVVIPAGSSLIVRKKAGSASTVSWNPTTPY